MRISIFHLENRSSYKDEYIKMIKILGSKCITFEKNNYSYFDFVNKFLFHNWKYRGTYLDCYEYLDSIGVNLKSRKITEAHFLNFLEFLLNIQELIDSLKYYSDRVTYSVKSRSILKHNIPLILEKLGYQAYKLDDRIIVSEFDISYDDLINSIPDDIYELLLSYKSLNNNGIRMKRLILDKLFDYLDNNQDKYKNYNPPIYNTIKLVISKMGVSDNIDKKYSDLSNYKLRKYYDNCFNMILFLIKYESILKYREEIREA
jgi:hypothetical protein